MNGRDLARLFDDFNARVWGGRLPKYRIRRPRGRPRSQRGLCRTKTRTLFAYAHVPDAEAPGTLLHEMCHIVASGHHGPRFMAELRRAADVIGEEWARNEVRLMEGGHKHRLPSIRQQMRNWAFSVYDPATLPGWREARLLLAHTRGLTVTEFFKRCPRGRDLWRHTREAAIREKAREEARDAVLNKEIEDDLRRQLARDDLSPQSRARLESILNSLAKEGTPFLASAEETSSGLPTPSASQGET